MGNHNHRYLADNYDYRPDLRIQRGILMDADTRKYCWNRLLVACAREGMSDGQRKSLSEWILSQEPADDLKEAADILAESQFDRDKLQKFVVGGYKRAGAQGFDVEEYRKAHAAPPNQPTLEEKIAAILTAQT